MSQIILGTAQLGLDYGISNESGQPSKAEAMKILNLASKSNIKILDSASASAYGTSLELISEYQKNYKDEFQIYSKLSDFSEARGEIASLEKKLGPKNLEGLSFHSFANYRETSKKYSIQGLREELGIKKIGVSVYSNNEILEVIANKNIDYIQAPFNVFDNDSQRGRLFAEVKSLGIEVHCRSIFLQGLFYLEPSKLPQNLSSISSDLKWFNDFKTKVGLSVVEFCLGYANSKQYIDYIVIGVNDENQLKENLEAIEFQLDSTIVKEIDEYKFSNPDLLLPVNW